MLAAPGVLQELRMAGVVAWFSLLGALASAIAGLVGLAGARGRRALAICALAGAVVTVVIGYYGQAHGRAVTDRALQAVDPSVRERVRSAGYEESDLNVRLAMEFALIPAMLGLAGLIFQGAAGRKG